MSMLKLFVVPWEGTKFDTGMIVARYAFRIFNQYQILRIAKQYIKGSLWNEPRRLNIWLSSVDIGLVRIYIRFHTNFPIHSVYSEVQGGHPKNF